MNQKAERNSTKRLAEKLLGKGYQDMPRHEQKIIASIESREAVSENVNETYHESLTFGDRLADKVASFGGSWTFINIFFCTLVAWIVLNSVILSARDAFDPYPFIFLNLVLSMVAAFQAPVIMMSQNRQSDKDRLAAMNNYEVNLKSELEIMSVHDKVNFISNEQLAVLLRQHEEELIKIREILAKMAMTHGG